MKMILTHADLMSLKAAKEFPELLLSYIEREWCDLHEAYSDGKAMLEFSLAGHDCQVCLGPGDSLPKELGWPEYVERVQLGGLQMYRTYVMEAEDCGILYYSVVGTLDEASERFLMEQAEMNER
ncbi:hypothetical protein ACLBWT_10170 [Paenibacillus sp. D51F]